MRVRLSAAGAGSKPFSSKAANTKASIGERTHSLFWTWGTAGRVGGTNDHHVWPPLPASAASAPHGAPISTQRVRWAISASESLKPGGICSVSSTCRTALSRRLSAGFPATTAGPRAPPVSRPSGESSCKPPMAILPAAEWQE